ncbi:MAG TPA: SulP family inorganic anion transporter [Pseudolabrys sp.]
MRSFPVNVRPDLIGGFISAVLAAPLAMGFGMFAFVSIGDQYFADGARAGLITAFVVGVVVVLLGDRTTTVYAPRITSTFFLGLLLYGLVHSGTAANPHALLAIFFAIIVLAGLFQALFGAIRLGTLIKFTPFPVMAGFQNAAAILLFLVQIGNVFGFDHSTPFAQALRQVDQAKPLSVLIAVIVFVAMWNAKRILPRVPPLILGLALGTALYYALAAANLSALLGPIIGSAAAPYDIAATWPDLPGLFTSADLVRLAPTVVLSALGLAIVAAIDLLLCAKLVAKPGAEQPDSNALLVRVGIGNAVTGGVGGITSGINIGASIANRNFGGRTPLSVLFNAAIILATLTALFPLVGHLPRVVLSAVIMVIAVQHIDAWTLRGLKQIVAGPPAARNAVALDIGVTVLVAVLCIAVNIVLAVFIGIALAAVLFIVRMSRSVIRRSFRCDSVHSRKMRPARQEEFLERKGGMILVAELQGALFFGSAERLSRDIARENQSATRYVIIDLRRVTEIDSTGRQILVEIRNALQARGINLLISGAPTSGAAAGVDVVEPQNAFRDIDRAMEFAEDGLLTEAFREAEPSPEIAIEEISVLASFAPDEIAAIKTHLRRTVYPKGLTVFEQGAPGHEIFFIARGVASVRLKTSDRDIRLVTFAAGTVFGELAILDKGARSASVVADEELVCHVLSDRDFDALSTECPSAAIKLLSNLGRELSGRLRRANQAIRQLEN